MKFAKRMDRFGEGIFSRLAEIKNKRLSEGKEVIDLSIGAPNIPPAEHIRKALCEEAMKPENYVYAISDTKKLLDTVADWYKRRYDVELDPDTEICSLLGSQEGLSHIALSIADEGDIECNNREQYVGNQSIRVGIASLFLAGYKPYIGAIRGNLESCKYLVDN